MSRRSSLQAFALFTEGFGAFKPPEHNLLGVEIAETGFANRPVTSELSHVDPPKTWGVRGVDGPIRAIVDVTVEPLTDNRAHLTIAIDFEGRGIGRVLVSLAVSREARKEMPANLAALKQHLEGTA